MAGTPAVPQATINPIVNGGDQTGAFNSALANYTPINYSQIYSDASKQFGGITQPAQDQFNQLNTQVGTDAQNSAAAIRAQAAPITNIYTSLAQQYDNQYQQDRSTAEQEKSTTLGNNAASAASQGFNPNTGFDAAQNRVQAKTYDDKINLIAQNWGLKKEQLAGEQSKDLDQLEIDAQKALMDGDTLSATIIGKVADLKIQEGQLINSAAQNMVSATNKNDQDYYRALYQSGLNDIKEQQLQLNAAKLAVGSGSGSSSSGGDISSLLAAMQQNQQQTITPQTQAKPNATGNKASSSNSSNLSTLTPASIQQVLGMGASQAWSPTQVPGLPGYNPNWQQQSALPLPGLGVGSGGSFTGGLLGGGSGLGTY